MQPQQKLIILAALFAVIASPMTYRLTRDVFGGWVASPSGCASQSGVLLHAAVFAGVLYLLWKLKMGKEAKGSWAAGKKGNKMSVVQYRN